MGKRCRFLSLACALLLGGCSDGNPYVDAWVESPGTHGFINLDAVAEGLEQSRTVADFENRVNEVFEGDGLVLLKGGKNWQGNWLLGCEDINQNRIPCEPADDVLFRLALNDGQAHLRGDGVNGYYSRKWTYPAQGQEPIRFPDQERAHSTGGIHYYFFNSYQTPHTAAGDHFRRRESYRLGSQYASQVTANADFERRVSSLSGFTSNIDNLSEARKRDIEVKRRSSAFAKAATTHHARTGWGARSKISKSAGTAGRSRYASTFAKSTTARTHISTSGFRSSSGFGV